ncbi:MAG TPA: hypothetical protein VKY89_07415 [Thermoanaerobaculia bacterium]|nr:hypothetical protein [Thermoanaerobaculia bacterium]
MAEGKHQEGKHSARNGTRRAEREGMDPEMAEDLGEAAPTEPDPQDPRDTGLFEARPRSSARGLGPEAGGQAGDTAGLSRDELAGPESVEELLEEGQAFEAGVISGVENAPNADQGEVTTRQVPEDDVPEEYLDDER